MVCGGGSGDLIVFAARFPCPPFRFKELGGDVARIWVFATKVVSLEVYKYEGEDDNCSNTKTLSKVLAECKRRRKLTHHPGHGRSSWRR